MTVLIAALIVGTASAYPIEPQPLRKLYRNADLVVVAKPGAITSIPERRDSWVDSKVVLTVVRIVKGKSREKEVTVYSPQGLLCPSPDRYPQGKTLLVFLTWSKTLRGYYAPALSYATKQLEEPALSVYLRRLEELSRIPAEPPGAGPSPWTLDWLVRCMEHPATRWEGAWEFQTRESSEESKPPFAAPRRLSQAQLDRITDALTISTTFALDEYYATQIFKGIPNHRFDVYLATELRYQYANGLIDWSEEIMILLAERLKLPDGGKLIEDFKHADDEPVWRRALESFLELVEQK